MSSNFPLKVIKFAFFLGLLYLFLVAISLMGGSFNLLGKGFAETLIRTTSNPFVGLMIGLLATSIVQSSSATTSMLVAMASGGVISITNAIPIIMGANIGTAVTSAFVSVGHISRSDEFERAYAGALVHDLFKILVVAILLPLELATGMLAKLSIFFAKSFYGQSAGGVFNSPVKVIVQPVVDFIRDLLSDKIGLGDTAAGIAGIVIAFLFIFVALIYMVKIMRQITATGVEKAIHKIFSANAFVTILISIVITAIVQSSSITTSLLIPLLGAGLLTLEHAFALTIGATIGTTVTALLAALAGNMAGLAIAFAHLLFNLAGALIFYPIPFMRKIPLNSARWLAHVSARDKKLVFIFIGTVFFAIPLILIFISKLF